ncbi:prolyl 3-hydroxylase 2 isoform X2 [Taeniopygia guttata]|uniref:prolyl 3-hydroxylase 2 isoform X2 n=1 Tax=Taeniopygia guttata TaxID=59729 RepID=UPI003BB87604
MRGGRRRCGARQGEAGGKPAAAAALTSPRDDSHFPTSLASPCGRGGAGMLRAAAAGGRGRGGAGRAGGAGPFKRCRRRGRRHRPGVRGAAAPQPPHRAPLPLTDPRVLFYRDPPHRSPHPSTPGSAARTALQGVAQRGAPAPPASRRRTEPHRPALPTARPGGAAGMAAGSRRGGARPLLALPPLLPLLLLPVLPVLPAAGGGCAAEGGPLEPFDALYASGVEAYYGGDFAGAARCLERALRSRRELRAARLRCRRLCRAQVRLAEPGPGSGGDLAFFGSVLRRAECVRRCEQPRLGAVSRHRAAEEVRADFQRRVPYSYLQRAYIQLNKLEEAANAAHTFFMANPEHMEIQQDLEKYKTTSGKVSLIDQEARQHMEDYSAGVRHYDREEYELAIEFLERALEGYYSEDEDCQVMCEGPQRFEEHEYLDYKAGLYEAIADHYLQVLACKHDCVRELATRSGRISPIENFLPLHYDYLQFAYYRVGDYVKALECAKSYLLFHPDDEDVLENAGYYKGLLESTMDPATIKPRKEAKALLRRHRLESHLLQAAAAGLGYAYTEPNYWNRYGARQDEHSVPSSISSEPEDGPRLSLTKKPMPKPERELKEGGPLLYSDVKFVYNSQQLNGTQRVLLDNVISEEQCRELHRVASGIMLAGDGYRGKTSPHTPNERFEGATVLKALKYGYEGRVPLRSARLFYDISEKARRIVESYFLLNSTLYFSYTHLVCRTALSGQQERRNDLSHPIHADNCLLDPEANECWKEPPAYTFRDYSALLYMNADFEGGEFIFTEMDAKTVTASIKPKCGRMISFSSGGENPHGVKAVTKGQRCAVALWFTLDPLYRELH